MHNPLRSEADVFRLVVVIGAAAALVVALSLITRPVWGVLLAALLIGVGIGFAWRVTRGSEPRSVAGHPVPDDTRRILVVANQTAAGRELLEEIGNRCRGQKCAVMLVSPALVGSRAERWASDIDEGLDLARQRMARSVAALRSMPTAARCTTHRIWARSDFGRTGAVPAAGSLCRGTSTPVKQTLERSANRALPVPICLRAGTRNCVTTPK